MTRPLKVGIIGSGIGGLSTAIALERRGIAAIVYEQATKLGDVGAGITLTPNVCKVLRAIDLEPDIARLGFEPERHVLRSWRSGRVLFAAPLRGAYRRSFDGTLYQIHRPDLHHLLFGQLRAEAIVLAA
jgi:salicylate hydroxylase